MKSVLLTLFIVSSLAVQGWGQENDRKDIIYDSDSASNPVFDVKNEPYKRYHHILSMHDPIQYLGVFPSFTPAKERMAPLDDREGNKGYWLEGDLNYRFNLYKGAYYSPKIAGKLRVTFDAGFTVRMTRDNSSPLLPGNNRFGLGADYLLSGYDLTNRSAYTWLTVQVHHYSNGQPENDFLHTSGLRNNYKGGDFSTNYIRGLLYVAKAFKSNRVLSVGLGYQRDTDVIGPLRVTEDMKNGNYGLNRMLLNLQLVRKPSFRVIENGETTWLAKNPKVVLRSEMSLILDRDLKELAPTNDTYRFGIHNYLAYYPFEKANVGVVAKYYYGRDYLNIRYDDVIHSVQFGITVDVNRYN